MVVRDRLRKERVWLLGSHFRRWVAQLNLKGYGLLFDRRDADMLQVNIQSMLMEYTFKLLTKHTDN